MDFRDWECSSVGELSMGETLGSIPSAAGVEGKEEGAEQSKLQGETCKGL